MKGHPSHGAALAALLVVSAATAAYGEATPNVFQAVLGTPGQKTTELSTEEFKQVLLDRSAVVLDARPFREFAMSHVPGALNVAARPGVPMSMYVSDVAEIGRLLEGNKGRGVARGDPRARAAAREGLRPRPDETILGTHGTVPPARGWRRRRHRDRSPLG